MLPVLVSLGPVKIYSMGVCMAFGFFIGLYYWWKLGRDEHLEDEVLFDAFFLSVIAFFVVGRSGYVALHAEDLGTVYRYFAFLRYPGLSYVSGVAGAVATLIMFARAKTWDLWKTLDSAAVALSLMLVFGMLGAFFNGSNPGRESALGFVFPDVAGRRFPVDFVGMIFYIITFGITMRVRRNFRFYSWYKGDASVAKDGLAALIFLALSGTYYMIRGFVDDALVHFAGIPAMSLVGLSMLILAGIGILARSGSDVAAKFLHHTRKRG